MPISSIKKNALNSLKGNWGKVVLLTFLLLLITEGISTIIGIALSGGYDNYVNSATIGTPDIAEFLYFLSVAPFVAAVTWFYLNLSRDAEPLIKDTFSPYKQFSSVLKLIAVTLVQIILLFLWSLPFNIVIFLSVFSGMPFVGNVLAIILLILPIIKAIAYSQSFFLLKDNPELGAFECVKESKLLMKGNKGNFFVLNLSFLGWFALIIIACVLLALLVPEPSLSLLINLPAYVGLLWLMPYISTSFAVFYDDIKD